MRHRYRQAIATALLVIICAIILSACSSGDGNDSGSGGSGSGGDAPTADNDITSPRLVSAALAGNAYRTKLEDDPPPAFLDAAAKGDTAVLLTFSEPVGPGAENADNYALTPDTPIDSALITKDKTQVMLLTGRLFDTQYQIDVSNVQDLSGQLISPGARIAQFDGHQAIEGVDTNRPRVVSAGAGDNNTVYVTFSKPMNNNAEDPGNYRIVQENVNSEVGGVGVIDAQFYNGERLTVQLTTRSQNEVSYRVMVSRVTDLGGRPLADRERGVDPTSVVFAGVPPGSSELVDNDNDGLPDNQEIRGHTVTLQLPDGGTQTVQVTSDPDNPDTDGDGINDAEELEYGSNPRSADTDGDSLGDNLELNTILSDPFAKDTDGDSLDDGLEYFIYKTSPLLADTDGDQLSDDKELFELNRDPLIADIPKVDINVGDVRLQIDERYTSTDETGKTVSKQSDTTTTLARSDDTSFARSDSGTTQISAGFEAGFEVGNGGAFGAGDAAAALPAGKAFGSANFQHTSTDSWAVNTSSARQSRHAYENSLNKGQQLFNNQTVARQVVGARIDVDLNVQNTGSIPFTLSNLEVTVLRPSPVDSRRLVPVATLVSNSQLITGTPLQINLGGFNTQAGPFLFANDEVFPNAVEELMRDPGGLVFEVANYDLSDELGRNFVFANQTARDRTVSITIDSGDVEPAQTQRVATSGVLDNQGITSPNPVYLGGFDAGGRAQGLPLDYILQARLGLKRYDRSLDVINPGPDGALDSTTTGDDVRATRDGIDVITAGPDGRLQSDPSGDDLVTNPGQRDGIVAGPDKTADSFATGDDLQVVAPNTTGLSIGSIVVSPGDDGILDTLARNDDVQQFITGYETRNSCSVHSPKVGDTCLVDSDCVCQDGDDDPRCTVGAKQGGTCSGPRQLYRVNSLSNGDFNRSWYVLSNGDLPAAADFGEITAKAGTDLAISFLQDLDSDGLFARNEYLAGSIDSAIDHLNNSDFGVNFDETTAADSADGIPDSTDTDRDGLGDFAEVRVGWRVGVDGSALRHVYPIPYLRDSDGDTLLDIEEQDITGYCEQANRNENLPVDASTYCSDFPPDPPVDKKDAIAILAGPNRKLDSGSDTDGDGAVDTVKDDDTLQMVDFDTNGDGKVDAADRGLGARAIVVTAGPDKVMDTPLGGDDIYISASYVPPALDPTLADTDRDKVDDRHELEGYDAGLAIVDGVNGNGIADTAAAPTDLQQAAQGNPVSPGGIIVLPGADGELATSAQGDDIRRPATQVVTDPLRLDTDDDGNSDGRELELGSNPTIKDGDEFVDSDRDGLSNNDEADLGWLVSVNGGTGQRVMSNPNVPDTDQDGLPDLIERDIRTDPNRADTDGDGLTDFDEVDDFQRFVRLAQPFPRLNIQGSASKHYGTDPNLSDTDGDGLSDYAELIECTRIILPGARQPKRICTSPVHDDTDLDGANDKAEINRQDGATDPTNADTDGDGRADGVEIHGVSDPLVRDVAFRVITRNITTNDECDNSVGGGELAWWFVLTPPQPGAPVLLSDALDIEKLEKGERSGEPDAITGARLLTESDEYGWFNPPSGDEPPTLPPGDNPPFSIPRNSYNFLGNQTLGNLLPASASTDIYIPPNYEETPPRACFYKAIDGNQTYFLNLDKVSREFALQQGQSFRFQAFIAEVNGHAASPDCGLPPNYIPTNISATVGGIVDKSYFYEDLQNSTGFSLTGRDADIEIDSSSGCKLDYKIDFEVVGGQLGGTP